MPVLIADQAVDVDLMKRHVVHEFQSHHDHSRHPEENDVEARDQDVAWIESLERFGLLWPALCAERPERRGEPGIEHIVVLAQLGIGRQLVFLPDLVFVATDIDVVITVIPGRNAMAPPELTADAPVLNVVHPFVVSLGPVFRNELYLAGLDCIDRYLGQRLDIDIPLIGQVRLDDGCAPVAPWNFRLVVLYLVDQTECIEVFDNFLSGIKPIESDVSIRGRVIDSGVVVENIVLRQVVTLAEFIVIEIVNRRNLDATGAELGVDIVIGNDRHFAIDQGQHYVLAHQVLVPLVFRMHRNGAVTEHGLGSGGCDDQMTIARGKRVAEVPQLAGFLL